MHGSARVVLPDARAGHCHDDSPRFLDAARGLLERQGITVVAVASTSAQALQQATQLRPDIALLDIYLGGESGFDPRHGRL